MKRLTEYAIECRTIEEFENVTKKINGCVVSPDMGIITKAIEQQGIIWVRTMLYYNIRTYSLSLYQQGCPKKFRPKRISYEEFIGLEIKTPDITSRTCKEHDEEYSKKAKEI